MDIVQMSVQAGVLITAILILRAITLYRLPKTSFLALWGIVIARLLVPFSLTSKWSVYNLLAGLLDHGDASVPVREFVVIWNGQASVLPGTTANINELDLTTGDVGDEVGGVRMIEGNSRFEDLTNLEYVEGDIGTEAYGIKIVTSQKQ